MAQTGSPFPKPCTKGLTFRGNDRDQRGKPVIHTQKNPGRMPVRFTSNSGRASWRPRATDCEPPASATTGVAQRARGTPLDSFRRAASRWLAGESPHPVDVARPPAAVGRAGRRPRQAGERAAGTTPPPAGPFGAVFFCLIGLIRLIIRPIVFSVFSPL